jgi:hypothetical protein
VNQHLVRHQLERLAAGDPHAPVAPALRVHVAGCDHCTTRLRALQASKTRFLSRNPAEEFARATFARAEVPAPVVEPRPWASKRMVAAATSGIAIAAVLLLWVGRNTWDGTSGATTSEIRLKGGVSLQVVAKHGDRMLRLHDGDALFPGDELAFEYSVDRPKYVLLLGIDDSGAITRYFPQAGTPEATSPVRASPRAQLPIGIQLDARKGEERLYALFSDALLDEVAVRAALTRALESARASGGGIAALPPVELEAQAISIWFRKP